MKKIINIVKNGTVYQVGAITQAEITAITSNISSISASTTANTTAITSIQSALNDVYTKSETNSAITSAISAIDKEIFVFADALPTEDIATNKIYVIPTTGDTGETNVYVEYLYNETTSAWEILGQFTADQDLSNFYTKDQTDAAIAAAVDGLDSNEFLTQDEYDAIESPSSGTTYFIYVNS